MLSTSHSLAFTFAMTMGIEHGSWVERRFRRAGFDGEASILRCTRRVMKNLGAPFCL